MSYNRWLMPLALLTSLAAAGWAVMDSRSAESAEQLQEEAHIRRLGDALIRQGISLYQKGEYSAAVSAWERYIQMAPSNADTQSIREMIGEAQAAVGRKSARPAAPPKTSAAACRANSWTVV